MSRPLLVLPPWTRAALVRLLALGGAGCSTPCGAPPPILDRTGLGLASALQPVLDRFTALSGRPSCVAAVLVEQQPQGLEPGWPGVYRRWDRTVRVSSAVAEAPWVTLTHPLCHADHDAYGTAVGDPERWADRCDDVLVESEWAWRAAGICGDDPVLADAFPAGAPPEVPLRRGPVHALALPFPLAQHRIVDGVVYGGTDEPTARVVAIDLDGAVRWTQDLGGEPFELFGGSDRALAIDRGGAVWQLDPTGARPAAPLPRPGLGEGWSAAQDGEGWVVERLDVSRAEYWWYDTDEGLTDLLGVGSPSSLFNVDMVVWQSVYSATSQLLGPFGAADFTPVAPGTLVVGAELLERAASPSGVVRWARPVDGPGGPVQVGGCEPALALDADAGRRLYEVEFQADQLRLTELSW